MQVCLQDFEAEAESKQEQQPPPKPDDAGKPPPPQQSQGQGQDGEGEEGEPQPGSNQASSNCLCTPSHQLHFNIIKLATLGLDLSSVRNWVQLYAVFVLCMQVSTVSSLMPNAPSTC